MKYYVTYSAMSDQAKNFSVIEAVDDHAAVAQLKRVMKRGWANIQRENQWAGSEALGLTEIPLQPQTFTDPAP